VHILRVFYGANSTTKGKKRGKTGRKVQETQNRNQESTPYKSTLTITESMGETRCKLQKRGQAVGKLVRENTSLALNEKEVPVVEHTRNSAQVGKVVLTVKKVTRELLVMDSTIGKIKTVDRNGGGAGEAKPRKGEEDRKR